MPTPEIIQRVREVHDELGKTPAKAEHAELRKSLDRVLEEPSHAPHYANLSETLFRQRAMFEAEHPVLAESIERLANALAAVGF